MDLKVKLLLGCLLTLVVLTGHLSCQDHDEAQALSGEAPKPLGSTEQPPAGSGPIGSRLKAALRKLMDFESFRKKFKKHYGSLTEEVSRHKLFLVRFVKAKLSIFAYQLGLSTSHTGINQMSDWTQSERDKLKNKRDTGELPRHRKRRSVEELAEIPVTVKPTSGTQQIGAAENMNTIVDRGFGYFTKTLKKATGRGSSQGSSKSSEHLVVHDSKGGVRVDLRKTKCFNKPRNQGKCGSCYIFASLAQYEFMYCLAYGKKVKFSEQLLVDCGPTHLQMDGCEGGGPQEVAKFNHLVGLQKHSAYPYTADQGECLLPSAGEETSVVYAKTKNSDLLAASSPDDFEYWLKKKVPLYASMMMGDESYYNYAGGIDSPTNCGDTGHAMLVVGIGSDKNGDYFILRNSLGTDWGRSGYYYVYKSTPCWRYGGQGWAPEGLRYRGKHAFAGVKSKRHEIDDVDDDKEEDEDDDDEEEEDDEGEKTRKPVKQVAPVYVSKPKPEAKREEAPSGHIKFDSDDEDDDDDNAGKKQEEEEGEEEEEDDNDDDHEPARTWTPAPPPQFEWKPLVPEVKHNPYKEFESKYEYDFNNDEDMHFTGHHNGYRGYNPQPEPVNYNGFQHYSGHFDRYDRV